MARVFKDGAGASYDAATTNLFTTVPFGSVLVDPLDPKLGQQANPTGLYFEMFNFGDTATFAQKADNSVAGEMRDCGECHVGGGMMEYVIDSSKTVTGTYSPATRTSLRDYLFGGAITAFNALIDIFNPTQANRGNVVVQNYSQTGVLEMDCLICHLKDYSWEARKEAVRNGEYDASRAVGAGIGVAVNGTQVAYKVYSASQTNKLMNGVVQNEDGTLKLASWFAAKINPVPDSVNCASCHLSQYNVDWKKRGDMWLSGTDTHIGIGCMGCHERTGLKEDPLTKTVTSNLPVGTEGVINDKLGLCDPAKGGASAFDALWNKLDKVEFRECADCHSRDKLVDGTSNPSYGSNSRGYGAVDPTRMHAAFGLASSAGMGNKTAYDKDGKKVTHLEIIDCTACHIRKSGFNGGAFVDGTGADAEGRVALHDEEQVARDMAQGNALYWDGGKLYAANLLTSFFIRDMNGMDAANNGLDANNDGRNAGMDPLLQTHVNNINIANNRKAITMEQNGDGSWVNETEMGDHLTAMANGIKAQLGIPSSTAPVLAKVSFLMVPFKSSHNVARAGQAFGANGCKDCHAPFKAATSSTPQEGGFYSGAYPIMGNMSGAIGGLYKFRFKSDQVTAFTKVNGLVDVTDSHPSVVTKKGDRSVPIPMLTRFDTPYVAGSAAVANQTLRNIDRSEVIYEATFKARDTAWQTTIAGIAPAAACSGPTSPFYCADPLGTATAESTKKSHATSTKGWLLKVEVRPAGDTDPAHITFRTAQLGKDNAVSMAEVFAALPGSFKSNTDFTVTESAGALTIAAGTGKEIRISPQSDVGPFGLAGNLWKLDPIKRPDASAKAYALAVDPTGAAGIKQANGDAWFSTRAQYKAYLDSIAAPANAAIASVLPSTTDATYGLAVTVSTNVTLTAQKLGIVVGTNPAKDNGPDTTYSWTINDATDADGYATVRTLPGAAVTTQFAKTGLFTVTLIARNPAGEETKAIQTVYVKPTPIGAGGNLDVTQDTTDPVNTRLTFAWAGGTAPVYDMVKISWGDGGYTQLQTANLGASMTHAYRRLAQYKNATTGLYDYTTKFYFYKANALVANQSVDLQLVTTSDLVLNARMIRLLDKTTNSYLVRKGSDVYLVVSLFNKGPGTNHITSVAIPAVPAPLSVLSSSANMGSLSGTTWTINRDLAKGQTATLTLKVHMDAAAATTKFTYPAVAGALTVSSTLPDSVPAGSVASEPVAGFAVTPY